MRLLMLFAGKPLRSKLESAIIDRPNPIEFRGYTVTKVDKPHIYMHHGKWRCYAWPGYNGHGSTPAHAFSDLVATIGYPLFREATYHLRTGPRGSFERVDKSRIGFRPFRGRIA